MLIGKDRSFVHPVADQLFEYLVVLVHKLVADQEDLVLPSHYVVICLKILLLQRQKVVVKSLARLRQSRVLYLVRLQRLVLGKLAEGSSFG